MSTELSPRQRQHLKGLGHKLAPVVQLGAAGASDAVMEALQLALQRHELVKVKLPKLESADARKAMATDLTQRGQATFVQLVGRVLLLYVGRDKDLPGKARIQLPS